MGSPPLGSGLRAVYLGHRGRPQERPRHDPPAPRVSRRCPFLRFHQPDCRGTGARAGAALEGGHAVGSPHQGLFSAADSRPALAPPGLLKPSAPRWGSLNSHSAEALMCYPWELTCSGNNSLPGAIPLLRQCFLCLHDFWDAMQRITPSH